MIPRAYIIEWQKNARWQNNVQVEQDLVIEIALVQLFKSAFLQQRLAFRGGTALHKLYLKPQARYSEDIDLVQVKPGPIKPILQEIMRSVTILGKKREVRTAPHNVTARYSFATEIEPIVKVKLKLEINTREHFTALGWKQRSHSIDHSYYRDEALLTTYSPEELLGTKLRALYQRKKGRDLFDLYHAITSTDVDTDQLLAAYRKYMEYSEGRPPTPKEFMLNMEEKMKDEGFRGDLLGLLHPEVVFNMDHAYDLIKKELLEHI